MTQAKGKSKITAYERKNTQLIALFDELTRRRPDLLAEIPSGAVLVMQIEGDEVFNRWAREIAEKNSPDRPKFFVKFTFKRSLKSVKALTWKQVRKLDLQSA